MPCLFFALPLRCRYLAVALPRPWLCLTFALPLPMLFHMAMASGAECPSLQVRISSSNIK